MQRTVHVVSFLVVLMFANVDIIASIQPPNPLCRVIEVVEACAETDLKSVTGLYDLVESPDCHWGTDTYQVDTSYPVYRSRDTYDYQNSAVHWDWLYVKKNPPISYHRKWIILHHSERCEPHDSQEGSAAFRGFYEAAFYAEDQPHLGAEDEIKCWNYDRGEEPIETDLVIRCAEGGPNSSAGTLVGSLQLHLGILLQLGF